MKIRQLFLGFNLLLLGFPMLSLSAIANPLIQSPSRLPRSLSAAPSFSCGSDLTTYRVQSLSNGNFGGIRCVKFTEGSIDSAPRFAWYGEGNWNGTSYRHIGHAVSNPTNPKQRIGYASDITGNGEQTNGNFNGNLVLEFADANTIRVTGAWNEEWQKVASVNYEPLPQPTTCGANFDKYKVQDTTGQRTGSGQRCMMQIGLEKTTWFGFGNWNNQTYTHLGVLSASGFGASDLCDPSFGSICNTFGYGALQLTQEPGGYGVTGAWSEYWYAWAEFPGAANP
jgi:hypothetical protein